MLYNRYLIQGVIGIGGMGAVYRGRDLHFPNVEKRVAVKEMINTAPDPVLRETIVRNFEREANILATLSHPAIPRIYDYFTQDERSYLVLEFIEGKDLETLIDESPGFFPESQVVSWAMELCEVLNYLHNHRPEPIIFRDIKPSNIMIDSRQHVILVDFGIAKPFQVGSKGTMIGTEGYSPPEQYRGEATPMADVYALGATLHHALTKRDPRLEAPFSFGERPIRQINPSVTLELESTIYIALHYNPESRFKSAQAFKEALLPIAIKAGVDTQTSYTATKGGASAVQSTKALWSFECEDEIRGTPMVQQGAVYIGSYDNNLYTLNAANGEFLWKYPTEGGVVTRPLFFDGNVYFGSEDKRLHVVNCRSGKVVWTYFSDGPIRSSPSFAEGHVFFGSDDHFLHAVNSVTGRRSWRMDSGAPIRSTPLVSNDHIYFGNENGDVFCTDLRSSIKWRYHTKRSVTGSPLMFGEMLFIGSMDWFLYAFDAKTGWVVWRYRLGKPTISTPAIAEGHIFTGASDGCIYAVDIRTTKELWRFTTDNQVTGSPLIYNDSLYIGSVDGFIYCIEYLTGRMRWKFRTGGAITGSPACANDIIYIGSTDHRIYALSA